MRYIFLVSADHGHVDYAATDKPVLVLADREGFSAMAPPYGMGKIYKTAEGAIHGLLLDHDCTNIRITGPHIKGPYLVLSDYSELGGPPCQTKST